MNRKTLVTLVALCFFVTTSLYQANAAEEISYTVKDGDTLYSIGVRYGVPYENIMQANNLNSTTIYAGQTLKIPAGKIASTYYVQPGDNLYNIARRFGVSVERITSFNNLTSSIINVGQQILIPTTETQAVKSVLSLQGNIKITPEDINLLARIIHAEARGEPMLGKIAVGAVILNRVKSPDFPKTIEEVIYQKKGNVYQFSPVQDGSINLEPDESAYKAAEAALNGVDPTGGALYFYNPEKSTDRWIRTLPVVKPIGNHVFAK